MSMETPVGKLFEGFYKLNRQGQSFMPKPSRGLTAPLKSMIGLWSRRALPMRRSDHGVEWKILDVRDELRDASRARVVLESQPVERQWMF